MARIYRANNDLSKHIKAKHSLRVYFQLSRLCFFWYDYGNFFLFFPGLQKQSRIGLKSEKYCPRGKIMFSRYPDFVLLRYDVILKARDPVVTENVIRETHRSLFQTSSQWRAVRIKRAEKYICSRCPHDLNA